MNEFLKDLLNSKQEDSIFGGVIESVRTKEKLNDIYVTLQSVIDGEVIFNQNNEFYLKYNQQDAMISFENLSAGMKSFVILKLLLEKGCLKEKDVLILDEPEIHLHPEWQLVFAEIIVLLHAQFGLHVLINTHSPYFLNAIEVYSARHHVADKCSYYLARLEDDQQSVIDDVSDSTEKIYQKLAKPLQDLENEAATI